MSKPPKDPDSDASLSRTEMFIRDYGMTQSQAAAKFRAEQKAREEQKTETKPLQQTKSSKIAMITSFKGKIVLAVIVILIALAYYIFK